MKRTLLAAGGVFALLVGMDQFTKWLIESAIEHQDGFVVVEGFFHIVHKRNTGGAWGILAGNQTFLVIVTFVALALFLYLFREACFRTKFFYSTGLLLLVSGSMGNLIDRLFRMNEEGETYVVDFLDFHIFGYNFPAFNVADICLTVGVALFTVDLLFFEKKRGEANHG